MNILMFSMTPLFPDRAMGGAQIQLKKVARHLGALGHEVTILCTRKDASMIPFNWDDTVRIVPVLRFKQPYPEPYATPVYNIAAAVQDVGAYLLKADRFYSHDGGLIFPFVYQTGAVPTVISLRSILFAETLQSAYLFQGDALILPSEHTRRSYIHTAGRFFPGFAERAVAVHNGLDFTVFRPTEPDRIRALIPVDTAQHRCLLFPHRPDTTKGVLEAIGVLDVLVNRRGMTDVRLLMPRWLADAAGPEVRAFYEDLRGQIAARGLLEHVVFHEWIPEALLPEYYSLGAVTLAIGSYVETFGNVPYESTACGTPAIIARVGPGREILPEELAYKVDQGDVESAAALAAQILEGGLRTSPATLAYLHTHFQQVDMVARYARIILEAERQPPLPYRFTPIDTTTRFILAPWCYDAGARGVYHDFRADYNTDRRLADLTQGGAFTFDRAAATTDRDQVMAWYRDGFIVPLTPATEAHA